MPSDEFSVLNECKALRIHPYELDAPGLSPGRNMFMGECAAACLNVKHKSGVRLQVDGDFNEQFELNWDNLSDQQHRSLKDLIEDTEHGACGIAIMVVSQISGKTVVERAVRGTGFDYWLGVKEAELPFQALERLEISGILNGDDKAIENRIKEKRVQIEPSDHIAPAYIAVIEFGKPTARIRWTKGQ